MIVEKRTKGNFRAFYDTEKEQGFILPIIEKPKTEIERTYHQFRIAFRFAIGTYVFAICVYLLRFFIIIRGIKCS